MNKPLQIVLEFDNKSDTALNAVAGMANTSPVNAIREALAIYHFLLEQSVNGEVTIQTKDGKTQTAILPHMERLKNKSN